MTTDSAAAKPEFTFCNVCGRRSTEVPPHRYDCIEGREAVLWKSIKSLERRVSELESRGSSDVNH